MEYMDKAAGDDKSKEKNPIFLPFIGQVTQLKSKDSMLVGSLMGVEFYIQKTGADLMSDVFVPAFYCKVVNRNDQAFWVTESRTYMAYMYKCKTDFSRPSSSGSVVRLSLDRPSHDDYAEVPLETLLRCGNVFF